MIFALILLFARLADAGTCCNHEAPPYKIRGIQRLIDRGNTHDDKVQELQEKLDRFLPAIEKGLVTPEIKAAIKDLVDKQDAERKLRNIAWKEAASRSLRAHDLVPRNAWPEGTVRRPYSHFDKGQYVWKIQPGDNTGWAARDAKQKPVWIPKYLDENGDDPAAVTGHDGTTVLMRAAFRNPQVLALTIAHEVWHFRQYTVCGEKKVKKVEDCEEYKKTRAELEIDAIAYERVLAKSGMVSWSQTEIASYMLELDTLEKKALKKIAAEKEKLRRGIPLDPSDYRENTEPFSSTKGPLREISKEAAAIRNEVENESLDRHFDFLHEFAHRSCAGDPPTKAEIDSLYFFPDKETYNQERRRFDQDEAEPGDCESDTYSNYMQRLSSGWGLMPPTAERVPERHEGPTAPRVPMPWELPQAAKPDVPMDGERDLLGVVSRACSDPGRFREAPLPDLSWFPARRPLSLMRPRDSLTPCEIQLWDSLQARNAQGLKLDLENLAQQAYGFQYRPPARPDVPYNKCIDPGNKCIPGIGR